MAKPPAKGHDATQDVSMSQLVPTERPVLHRGSGAKNDMSLWGGVVVGTQDFAPPAQKQAKSPPWKWIAISLAVVGAALAAFLIVTGGKADKPAPSAQAITPAPVPVDAAPAVTPDAENIAAVDAATPDAAPAVAAMLDEADAVSGVGPIIKPAKKKVVRKTKKKKAPAKKAAKKKR